MCTDNTWNTWELCSGCSNVIVCASHGKPKVWICGKCGNVRGVWFGGRVLVPVKKLPRCLELLGQKTGVKSWLCEDCREAAYRAEMCK